MEKKEYIVLINFQSVSEGLEYVNGFQNPFCFLFSGNTYDPQGNTITNPIEFTQYEQGEIWVDIQDGVNPGQLYVENNFLKYYKEL